MLPLLQRFISISQYLLAFILCWSGVLVVFAQSPETLDRLVFDPVLLDDSTPDYLAMQDLRGRQINTLGLAFNSADSNETPVSQSLDSENPFQDIESYTAAVAELEREEGLFSPLLIQNLLTLASLYQQQNNHMLAIEVLERADYISRVNNGLYHSGQIPIIKSLIESYLAREDYESVSQKESYLVFLNQKLQAQGSPARIPAFAALADSNMGTFGQSLLVTPDPEIGSIFRAGGMNAPGAPEYARYHALDSLFRARRNYSVAISTLIANQGSVYPNIVELEYKFLETIFLTGFREELIFNPHYYLTSARKAANQPHRWTYLRRNHEGYALGINTFERILDYIEDDPGVTDLERVRTMIEFADWHLVFGWRDAAREGYANAFAFARDLNISSDSLNQLFIPDLPVQLPLFTAKPNSREKFSIDSAVSLQYAGYIDVSYSVSQNGSASGIRILDKSDESAFDVEGRLRRYLKNSPFRPRIVNGELVDQDEIRMRYYYTYL